MTAVYEQPIEVVTDRPARPGAVAHRRKGWNVWPNIRYAPVTERGKSTTIWEHERPADEAFMTEPCHCTEGEKRAT